MKGVLTASRFASFEDDFGLHRPPEIASHTSTLHQDTNLLERLFLEERRRVKIIPNGFREKPVFKFMLRALIRAAERSLAELFLFNLCVGQSRLRLRFCDGAVGHVGWLIHRCQDIYGVDFRGALTLDFHCRFPPLDL